MLSGPGRQTSPAPSGRRARVRHLVAVATIATLGLGGGVLVGVVNTPDASAAGGGPSRPAPAELSAPAELLSRRAVATTVTTVAPAPITTVAHGPAPSVAPARPAVVAPARPAAVAPPAAAPAPRAAAAPAPRAPAPAPAPAPAVQTRSQVPAAPAQPAADSCSAAISYLQANSAPGFSFECPGYALGHQAMTCVNVSGVCAGEKLIVISTVCPASYMNEAHNSWVLTGLRSGSIDPYGYCP
jgi:hypothetical protein